MKKFNTTTVLFAAVAATGFASTGMAMQDKPEKGQDSDPVVVVGSQNQDSTTIQSRSDRDTNRNADVSPEQAKQMEQAFVDWSANCNLFEIEAAKLAQETSDNDAVKAFAKQVQTAHESAQEDLESVAKSAGYEVPSTISKDILQEELELMKQNAQESPDAFNDAYIFGTVGDTSEALLWHAKAAETCQNQELRQYAQNLVPQIRQANLRSQRIALSMIGGETADLLQMQADRARLAGSRLEQDAKDAAEDVGDAMEDAGEDAGTRVRDRLNGERDNESNSGRTDGNDDDQ